MTDEHLDKIRELLPELPEQLIERFQRDLRLPEYDARVICDDKDAATWFQALIGHTANYKAAANWLLGPVKSESQRKGNELE